jgi:hypothetical protein
MARATKKTKIATKAGLVDTGELGSTEMVAMATSAEAVLSDEEGAVIVTKGRGRSRASQGNGWTSVLNSAQRFYKNRPDDHLSSLLAELRELNISRKDPGKYYRTKEMVSKIGFNVLRQYEKSVDDDFCHPTVRNSEYALGHISTIRYLSRFIKPTTTGIFELGSGWSSNLFQLYIAHGATRSKKLIYYGGEYTKEGQLCAKYIASKEPQMNYRAFQFDFRKPNLEFLKRQRGHILIFTSHAIEQVDIINASLFEQLKALPNEVTVIHFEPVGWQRVPALMKMRNQNDEASFEEIGQKATNGDIGSVTRNSAWWSWRLEYNKNLIPIITKLEKDKDIIIRRTEYDFDGVANVLNPSSLIHYDFRR